MTVMMDPHHYLQETAAIAEPIFAKHQAHELDEQAGPAYFRGLSLSRWIFWKRLTAAMSAVPTAGEVAIDFGCGFGMLLPFLAERFELVRGIDLMPDLGREFLAEWNKDADRSTIEAPIFRSLDELDVKPGSVDCITALDVLEHIENLPELLQQMIRLLKPNGTLIVSGPTENWLYRLGRSIVGFSGDYHVSDIHVIRHQMEEQFQVTKTRTILPVLPLFEILSATPLPNSDASRDDQTASSANTASGV